jgi:hypothetical protein
MDKINQWPISASAQRRACRASTALSNSGAVSGIEPFKAGFDCCDLFINLTDRQAEVISPMPPLQVDGQFTPMYPEIFEGSPVA